MRYFVVTGQTESSDDLPILVWTRKPRDKEVEAVYRDLLPEEFDPDGPGFVNWKMETIDDSEFLS